MFNTRMQKSFRLVLLALFIALAAVGANLKISGSIAFDSLPAFLAAMLIGGPEGAVAGAFGHLFSAMLAGFPLTLPMHLVIAVEMAAICYLTGWLVQKRHCPIWLSAIVAFVLNAFVSPLIVIIWPGLGLGACIALLLPLTLASAANVAGAAMLAYALKKPYVAMFGATK
jgi:uncharacterized membrane protein